MELPFYYDVAEFQKNFDDNFKKWKNGTGKNTVDEFKAEYRELYEMFYQGYERGIKYYVRTDKDNFSPEFGSIPAMSCFDIMLTDLMYEKNPDADEKELVRFLDYGIFDLLPYGIENVILDVKLYKLIRPLLFVFDENINYDEQKIKILNYSLPLILKSLEPQQAKAVLSIKSNITQTQLIELVKALIENGTVKGTQKDIIHSFSCFFEKTINNPDKLINDLKVRKNGNETKFLNELKDSLYDFIIK